MTNSAEKLHLTNQIGNGRESSNPTCKFLKGQLEIQFNFPPDKYLKMMTSPWMGLIFVLFLISLAPILPSYE